MIPRKFLSRAGLIGAGLAIGLMVSACGLGRDAGSDGEGIRDPVVAATINGRPIYIEDVRAHAVARGLLQEGEDIDANSQAFFQARDELIERRLFAMEAEARGLDRDPVIRRQIEMARDAVLWSAIAEDIIAKANDPETVERLYRENIQRLGRGEQISIRHIQFATREAADAAKRRLAEGERFEALAFELSTDRDSAADGGLLGWGEINDLRPAFRAALQNASVGSVVGPFEQDGQWHLARIDDRRAQDAESLEALRPQIVQWLLYQETMQLRDRLERDARIVLVREPEVALDPGEEVPAPADATTEPVRPAPDAALPPGQTPPPFPFPMGPGGVTGSAPQQTAPPSGASAPTAPAPQAEEQAPAQ
jgi:peptidyl-prolyl cis-trans isomerase C